MQVQQDLIKTVDRIDRPSAKRVANRICVAGNLVPNENPKVFSDFSKMESG